MKKGGHIHNKKKKFINKIKRKKNKSVFFIRFFDIFVKGETDK